MDETHIFVVVRNSKQPLFRCCKEFTFQNMMVVVYFDHHFLFECLGWEGSTVDMQVLRWVYESEGFIMPAGMRHIFVSYIMYTFVNDHNDFILL